MLRARWNHRDSKAGSTPGRIKRSEVGVVDVFCRAPPAYPYGACLSGRGFADRRERAVSGDDRPGILESERLVCRRPGHDP